MTVLTGGACVRVMCGLGKGVRGFKGIVTLFLQYMVQMLNSESITPHFFHRDRLWPGACVANTSQNTK